MSNRLKWLLLKATVYSLWAQLFAVFNPSYLLSRSIQNEGDSLLQPEQKAIVRDVSKVTRILGRRAPWDPMCLNLSYVAKKILREYGIESTFRLGYLEGRPKDKIEGHAWITIHGQLVTGWLPNLGAYVEMVKPQQKELSKIQFEASSNTKK